MQHATFIEDWLDEALEKGFQQGVEKGMEQGLQQGLQQGVQQGQQEGVKAQQEAILQTLQVRFDLPSEQLKLLAQQIQAINNLAELKDLFTHAVRDFSLADFKARLSKQFLKPSIGDASNES